MSVAVNLPRAAVLGALASFACAVCLALFTAPALAGSDYGFSGVFGSETSSPANPEPLSGPTGIAVNQSTGDVYVVDQGNERVEYFSSTGAYLGKWNGSATPAGEFSSPESIAVDNDPSSASYGDVYVVDVGDDVIDKFSPTGTYESQLAGTCAAPGTCPGSEIPFAAPLRAIAVDASGDLWVHDNEGNVDEFSAAGGFVKQSSTGREARAGLALDSAGDIYLTFGNAQLGKYNAAFEPQDSAETEEIRPVSGLAVDPSTDELYVDRESVLGEDGKLVSDPGHGEGIGSMIAEYGPGGEPFSTPVQQFGFGHLAGGGGVAIDSTTGVVYAADSASSDVDIFTPGAGEPPLVTGQSSSEATSGSVALHALIDPDYQATSYAFEYAGEEAQLGTPAATTVTGTGTGTLPAEFGELPASAPLTGLTPGTTYYYRAAASNHTATTQAATIAQFTTLAATPILAAGVAEDITQASAAFTASVNPHGGETTYRFLYTTRASYEAARVAGAAEPLALAKRTPEGTVPAGNSPVAVSQQALELTPGTAYVFALQASNPAGDETGPVATFTTEAGPPPPPAPPAPEALNPPPGPSPFAAASLPAVLPYSTIAELNTKEAKEDKGIPNLAGSTPKKAKCPKGKQRSHGKCVKSKGSKKGKKSKQ
jgi:DNA-binding beta-propeller fold protein YncE